MNRTIEQHSHDPCTAVPIVGTETVPDVDGAFVELSPFRLAEGVSEQALFDASDALQRDFLARQPGYVRRELLRGADGGWCDLVIWRDASSFAAAMAAAESDAGCGRFFALLQLSGDPGAGIQLLQRVRRYGEDGP